MASFKKFLMLTVALFAVFAVSDAAFCEYTQRNSCAEGCSLARSAVVRAGRSGSAREPSTDA
jgi:hypothetical protein